MTLALALLLGALLQAPAPPADTTDGRGGEAGVKVQPRLTPLYSANYGLGVGGGVAVRNAGWDGSDVVLDLRLQPRYREARLTAFTGDPYAERVYGLVAVAASTTGRRRYYGLGPNTLAVNELYLSHDAASAEGRVGVYPFGTTALVVQPSVRLLYDRSGGVNGDASEIGLGALDPASQEAVRVAVGEDRYGLSVGLELATDLRDRASYPRSGTFASVEARRFVALDGSDLQLARYAASGVVYVPIRGRAVGVLRGVGVLTRSLDGDGDGASDPIPFFYLPVLDDRVATAFRQDRLTGRDVLAGGAGVRVPLADVFGLYALDALLMGYLGNAYDDVFEQFEPSVSFAERVRAGDDGRAPLRPSLALGLSLVDLDDGRVVVGGTLGVGPGGFTVASFRVAYDLRDARPLFR